jgi:hypothetical protein
MLRHELVGVGEVAVVVITTSRDASGDGSIEFRRIESPLLARVMFEKLFVQATPNLTGDRFLRSSAMSDRLGIPPEKFADLSGGQIEPVQLVHRVHVDRKR